MNLLSQLGSSNNLQQIIMCILINNGEKSYSFFPYFSTDPEVEADIRWSILPPLIFLELVTCLSNVLVIYLVRTTKKLNTITNIYVSSLAVADFLVGMLIMAGMTTFTIAGRWPLGGVMCNIWTVLDACCCQVSIFMLLCISWDRYTAVARPMTYRQTQTNATVWRNIAIGWLLAPALWAPPMISVQHFYPEDPEGCTFYTHPTFTLLQAVIAYYIPISAIICMYGICIHKLHQRLIKGT